MSPNLVPGSGDRNKAKILFLGEAPGTDEVRLGIPFIGQTGKILREKIIRGAGIPEDECFFDNVCQEPRPTSWLASFEELCSFVINLRQRINARPNLRVIVPVGGKALY